MEHSIKGLFKTHSLEVQHAAFFINYSKGSPQNSSIEAWPKTGVRVITGLTDWANYGRQDSQQKNWNRNTFKGWQEILGYRLEGLGGLYTNTSESTMRTRIKDRANFLRRRFNSAYSSALT